MVKCQVGQAMSGGMIDPVAQRWLYATKIHTIPAICKFCGAVLRTATVSKYLYSALRTPALRKYIFISDRVARTFDPVVLREFRDTVLMRLP